MTEMLADETGFYPALNEFLELKYPSTLKDRTPWISITRPILFHDRHISPSLTLKSIKPFGFSLARYLCELCDEEITDFVGREGPLLSGEFFLPFQPREQTLLTDAFDVLEYHCQHVANLAIRFASKFYFHPADPDWNSLFYLPVVIYENGLDRFSTSTSLMVYCDRQLTDVTFKSNDEMLAKVRPLQEALTLAYYEMFAMSASDMIQRMKPIPLFDWEMTKSTKYNPANLTPMECGPDALTGLAAKIKVASRSVKVAQSKRKPPKIPASSSKRVKKATQNKGTVYIPSRLGERQNPYHPKGKDYVQHAWSSAVQADVSFIVFHCGKYERIGFRHRETQTLYLSELIDPSQEFYGKMHAGLQLAIIKDALERRAAEAKKKVPRKRKRDGEADVQETVDQKRRKKNQDDQVVIDSNPSSEVVENLLASRHVALMRLHFGVYQSPAPSSFLRVGSSCAPSVANMQFKEPKGNTTYPASDYFTITLTDIIAVGRIGVIYKASASFRSGSKTVEYSRLAVKMSISAETQEALTREYEIYQHLARIGRTQNILPVHGLFRDTETGALALVMDLGGISLSAREIQEGGDSTYTDEERKALMAALKRLHRARVRYGDIHGGNFLIDDSCNVHVIGFDSAQVTKDDGGHWFEHEKCELAEWLGCDDDWSQNNPKLTEAEIKVDDSFRSELELAKDKSIRISMPVPFFPVHADGIFYFHDGSDPDPTVMDPPTLTLLPNYELRHQVWKYFLRKPSADGQATDEYSCSIVVKMARENQKEALEKEYEIYQNLANKNLVPHAYGLFKSEVPRRGSTPVTIYALVMKDAGISLYEWAKIRVPEIEVQKKHIKEAIERVHAAGYALSSGLDPPHILLEENNVVSFISLHRWVAASCTDDDSESVKQSVKLIRDRDFRAVNSFLH